MDLSILNSQYIYILVFVDLILKGFALWDSARREKKYWFIGLLVINSLGLLPLTYLLYFRKIKDKKISEKRETKKK